MISRKISEGELIEIAQRFRKLEDLVEEADLLVCAHKETLMSHEHDVINEVRSGLEKALESCREDMTLMQELIRSEP